MQDADYSEAERTGVQGRWTICPRTSRSQWDFAFKAGVTTREPGVPAIPCDDAAIDRAARAMFADWVDSDWGYTGPGEWDELGDELQAEWRASAVKVLRAAAGETGSADA